MRAAQPTQTQAAPSGVSSLMSFAKPFITYRGFKAVSFRLETAKIDAFDDLGECVSQPRKRRKIVSAFFF